MARSPDLRIDAERRRLPMLHSSTVAGVLVWTGRVASASEDARMPFPLLAYSGGTVWVSHPLPLAAG